MVWLLAWLGQVVLPFLSVELYLEYPFMREEKVGGFKVTVKDPVVMEMMYCPQQLYHQRLHLTWEAWKMVVQIQDHSRTVKKKQRHKFWFLFYLHDAHCNIANHMTIAEISHDLQKVM